MTPESARPWIRTLRPEARLRLLCFPFAGGGTLEYRTWQERFAASVDVCPLVLPGRETRMSERAYDDVRPLVQALARDLAPVLREAPFAFAGHSMGAWIAFELARELRRQRRHEPVHLFLSARWAPHLPDRLDPIYQLPDDDFVAAIQDRYNAIPPQLLARPQILQMFVPTLRADFTLLDTYRYADEPPLDVPITAMLGTGDPVVPRDGVEAWAEHTTDDFTFRRIPGGHFFLRDSPDQVCEIIGGVLRQHL